MSCAVCLSVFWDALRGDVEEAIEQTDIQILGLKTHRKISQSTSVCAVCTKLLLLVPLRLILVPFLLVGKYAHAPCSQHGQVRNDETDQEYETRYLLVYGADGFFVVGLIYTSVLAIVESADSDFNPRDGTALIIDITFYGGFIFLNTLLLHAMHRRSAWQTRCCIAGTVAFALITITLLALFIIHKVLDDDSPDDDDSVGVATVASWTLRGVLVAFYAAMAHNYAKLWNAYDDSLVIAETLDEVNEGSGAGAKADGPPPPRIDGPPLWLAKAMALLCSFGAALVVSVTTIVIYSLEPEAFWEATTI